MRLVTNMCEKKSNSVLENKNTNNFWMALGGGVLLALSIIFISGAFELGLGSPFRLGTGAFPLITGVVLAILAIVIMIKDLKIPSLHSSPDWVSFFAICAAIAVFALCVGRFGLIPATFITTLIASLPEKDLSTTAKITLGIFVSFCAWLLFIKALNLPFKAIVGI